MQNSCKNLNKRNVKIWLSILISRGILRHVTGLHSVCDLVMMSLYVNVNLFNYLYSNVISFSLFGRLMTIAISVSSAQFGIYIFTSSLCYFRYNCKTLKCLNLVEINKRQDRQFRSFLFWIYLNQFWKLLLQWSFNHNSLFCSGNYNSNNIL